MGSYGLRLQWSEGVPEVGVREIVYQRFGVNIDKALFVTVGPRILNLVD